MNTKKNLLPQILQEFKREGELETIDVHIIETDVWYT